MFIHEEKTCSYTEGLMVLFNLGSTNDGTNCEDFDCLEFTCFALYTHDLLMFCSIYCILMSRFAI